MFLSLVIVLKDKLEFWDNYFGCYWMLEFLRILLNIRIRVLLEKLIRK